MVAPEETPVTKPLAFTVATEVFELVQTPFTVALAKAVVEPAHTSVVPLMAATTGKALTVTEVLAVLVQPFADVTV